MGTLFMDKTSRMDLRLTDQQRLSYERAADVKGQTLTQWATSHLDESAERDIAAASQTVLSSQDFDAFCEMLESPLPKATVSLLEFKSVWE